MSKLRKETCAPGELHLRRRPYSESFYPLLCNGRPPTTSLENPLLRLSADEYRTLR